jgi:uncharacterized protein (DUF1330 family)
MEVRLASAYWVVTYRSISNPDAFAAYAKLALPAIEAAGGRFLARGNPAKTYEAGIAERVVVIAFDSLERAIAAHDTPQYAAALKALGNGAVRDMRIVEGLA